MASAVGEIQKAVSMKLIKDKLGLNAKKKEAPKPVAPTPQQNLLRTARVLWVVAYSILWIGLTPRGWQKTGYTGTNLVNGQAYRTTYIGSYGLWDVSFQLTSETANVPYTIWGTAQRNRVPLTLVQLTQAWMVLAAAAGAAIFASMFRAYCTRDTALETRFLKYGAWFSLPQFVCTLLAVICWRVIPPSAFQMFCTKDGCVREPASTLTVDSISYSWVFVLISAIVSLFLALTMWRLAMWNDEEEVEVDLELSGAARRQPPLDNRKKSGSADKKGPKSSVDYFSVAKVGDGQVIVGNSKDTPSWLQGIDGGFR